MVNVVLADRGHAHVAPALEADAPPERVDVADHRVAQAPGHARGEAVVERTIGQPGEAGQHAVAVAQAGRIGGHRFVEAGVHELGDDALVEERPRRQLGQRRRILQDAERIGGRIGQRRQHGVQGGRFGAGGQVVGPRRPMQHGRCDLAGEVDRERRPPDGEADGRIVVGDGQQLAGERRVTPDPPGRLRRHGREGGQPSFVLQVERVRLVERQAVDTEEPEVVEQCGVAHRAELLVDGGLGVILDPVEEDLAAVHGELDH